MSIFRNRSPQRIQRPYEQQDREESPAEPRLFTARQAANHWPNEEEPSVYHAPGERPRSQTEPQWQEQRSARVEDMHPRELSFWREERLYEDYNRNSRQTSPFRFVLITASLLVIATFSWLAFRWVSAPHSETPPLIYADPAPYKMRPDHPGGLQVPYQDRLVYNRLSPESQQPVERLLAPPESPMAVPQQQVAPQQPTYTPQPGGDQQQQQYGYEQQQQQQAPYPQQQMLAPQQGMMPPQQQTPMPAGPLPTTPMPAPGYGQQYPQQQPIAPAQQPMMAAPQMQQPMQAQQGNPPIVQQQPPRAVTPPPVQSPQQKPASLDEIIDSELQPSQKAKSTTTKAAKKTESVTALSTKSYRIQVATLADEVTAKKERDRIVRTHGELTSGLKSSIQKVEGEAGVCRVLFGPFPKREGAIKQCAKFRSHGLSCIVLNPAP